MKPFERAWSVLARIGLVVVYTVINCLSSKPLQIKAGAPIISLTTYSRRLWRAYLTIESLFNQDCPVGGIYLWVWKADAKRTPRSLKRLTQRGLQIRIVADDSGPYKKLVHCTSIEKWQRVATADDDVFYPRSWLRGLIETADRHPHCVICYRGQLVRKGADGSFETYANFTLAGNTFGERNDIIPTGVSGVLYPRDSITSTLLDRDLFMSICPNADDIWFRFATAAAGFKVAMVKNESVNFPSTNPPWAGGLWYRNFAGGNDASLARAVRHFGSL